MTILWLSDALPSSIAGELPDYAQALGQITSPFHILDLGIVFPGFFVAAFFLYKKRPFGYVLAPSFLAFSMVLSLSMLVIVLVEWLRGFSLDTESLLIFPIVLIISGTIFVRLMRRGIQPVAAE